MTRIQQVVDTLFEQFPAYDLGGGPERYQFDRLREVLTTAADWDSTLRRLYQADRCDELALGLLWMTDRLERDEARSTATSDEEEVFQRSLRRSLGLPEAAFADLASGSASDAESLDSEAMSAETSNSADAPTAQGPITAPADAMSVTDEGVADVSGGSVDLAPPMSMEEDGGTSDPEIYGRLLERFMESVQSGADDRSELMSRLRVNSRAVQADTSMPEEYHRYAALVDDFLGYIDEHQLMDDIRVLNLVTNLQEPFGQWLATEESSRAGMLDQAVEMQRDFRTMFE